MTFRILLVKLLWLYLIFIFTEFPRGLCLNAVCQPPKPSIRHLKIISDKQTLLVSWLVNRSGLVIDSYEIQISRTERRTVIYQTNVSSLPVDSDEHAWSWTSDLPLECVDHSVRIRSFYNNSVASAWSDWSTQPGKQAENKAQLFPYDRVLREGSSAMFCCVPQRGVNVTSITLSKRKYTLISVGGGVKAITVNNLSIPTNAFRGHKLSCGAATGETWSAWIYISFPAQKPVNISCVTSDMTTVTCSWTPGRKRYLYDKNQQTHTLHIEKSDKAAIDCTPSSCSFPAVPQLEEYNIRVVVKDQLGEATERYSFNISDRVFPVVERPSVSAGVTDSDVSWIIQGNLTQMNLLCQVSTNPGGTTELSCNNVSGICSVKLEHLLPNTRYSVRVRCSVSGGLWGEWTQPTGFITYPMVTLDVWRRVKPLFRPNRRQVTLLWKPHVFGSATTVNIQDYIIKWRQGNRTQSKKEDGGQTQVEISIGPGQYDFTLEADLHSGSTVPAHITIPQNDDEDDVAALKLLSSSTAGGFNLTWDQRDAATCGYTVEWCSYQTEPLQNTSSGGMVEWCIVGNCTLQWMKVPLGNNTLSLPAGDFQAGCRYTFNIYGCTEQGHRLLEVQTGYSQELKYVWPPSLVEPVQSTSSSVTLEWRYNEEDAALPAFITGYLVTVQEVAPDMLPGHVAKLFNVSVPDPWRKSVTIKDLQQNQEYTFSVTALTNVGPGQAARISIRTRIRTNYSSYFATILTPVLLLLCLTVLLWPQRKTLKSGLKEMFVYPAGMNIKTPDLDNFLHEACERLQSQPVEECSSCDIEVLDTWNQTSTLSDPELLKMLPSPGSESSALTSSPSGVLFQADYCPQSAMLLSDAPDRETSSVTNKTYFHIMDEDLSTSTSHVQ